MPAEFRDQTAIAGNESEGTLTDLALALASPAGSFFDVSALHIVVRPTLRHLGELEPTSRFAVERYRPNIVVDTEDEPFAENNWTGTSMRFGDELTASVLFPTMRCIMTTLPQGDLPRDNNVLRALTRHNRIDIPGLGTWSCVGAYATVTARHSSVRRRSGVRLAARSPVPPAYELAMAASVLTCGAVHRILVELGQHVRAERLDGLDRDIAFERRRQQPEHHLVDPGVLVPLQRARLRRGCPTASHRGDARIDLVGGRIGQEVRPLGTPGGRGNVSRYRSSKLR